MSNNHIAQDIFDTIHDLVPHEAIYMFFEMSQYVIEMNEELNERKNPKIEYCKQVDSDFIESMTREYKKYKEEKEKNE